MIAIMDKYEHNTDFHQIVDFVEASHLRIETTDEGTKILATVDGKLRTISESSIRRNLKLQDEAGISSLPDAELFKNLTLMGYNILPNQKFSFQKGTTTSPTATSSPSLPPVTNATIPTVIPSDTLQIRQYTKRARIGQSLAHPPVADEPVSPIRDDSQDAPIKGRSLDEGEEATVERSTERGSDDTEEMVIILTSLDAASILTNGVSVSISPVTEVSVAEVPTGCGFDPTASPTFTTATVATPYIRRKGKEKMVESDTPKKKKLQEQIDIQVAREIEEQMFAADLPIGERIELISNLVKYQDNYAKVIKYQIQQRKPLSKKQQKEFYMSVPKSHAGWKATHFKGMTLEEIKEKIDPVWKQIQYFIPIGSKEESERFKRKGIRLEQDSAKKVKISEEVPEENFKGMMQLIDPTRVEGSVWGRVVEVMGSSGDSGEGARTWESGW
nr:hypothetical protein [Tanacetum cinerariifolium]